jgi:hypothetical protein
MDQNPIKNGRKSHFFGRKWTKMSLFGPKMVENGRNLIKNGPFWSKNESKSDIWPESEISKWVFSKSEI